MEHGQPEIKTRSTIEFVTNFLRDRKLDCHGVYPIVDNVDMDSSKAVTGEFMGMHGLALVIIAEAHCPVCEECMTFSTIFAVDEIESFIMMEA